MQHGNRSAYFEQDYEADLKAMVELIHEIDPTRPVTCGINMALNTMHFAGLGVYHPGTNEPARKQRKRNKKAQALLAEEIFSTPLVEKMF